MVNIIGAGIAGLSAAITLAKRNISCNLISSQTSERAQSVLAEGGINAALDVMGEGDSPVEHLSDTMRGGCDLADPEAVAGLTSAAPELVRWLNAIGVPFQMDGNKLIQRNFGGQKKKRTAYAKSSTGKAVMTALIDEVRQYEVSDVIYRLPHHDLTDICIENGRCSGATVRDAWTGETFYCPGPVILAVGGMNGLFPGRTTGTTQNTGNAAALAFAKGVEFGNLEMLQYHPTTVAIPGKRLLVSEAARGEGGRLFTMRDSERWYFMDELYPELGNLSPRDVISREIARLDGQVNLDLTELPKETWKKKLPDMREEIEHYLNLDPAKKPVPVSPGIHFFMGGILVDKSHKTNIPGLYAAGECACIYHGANRLGGNSLLGALYGGQVAANSAAEETDNAMPRSLGYSKVQMETPIFSEKMGEILYSGLGILRDEKSMKNALSALDSLETETETEQRRLALGRAMLLSALARKESRGAHTRTDYPARDDEHFKKMTVAAYSDGEITISFREIPT